ncbi:hypothetical protein [Streptomyces sp. H27-C3]|uniref:hypothetical protein n=1 Tax=Streptomyces sp. H27-C3 TaxID=3046305 RepID=UPI0024BB61F4|nr:hypothetical protein [Streptomyces sp. H27-C3]MDJ0466095.1 hypothetical protein [Streptomyces sp. H27-C3]
MTTTLAPPSAEAQCAQADPIVEARKRWAARRRRLIGYGQWQPFVDAPPVRAHVQAILGAGMSLGALTERLGLAESVFDYLLYGDSDHEPGEQVRREPAEAVMAYWPTLGDFPDCARIDPTGTRRRVEALGALGWPRQAMADALGHHKNRFYTALASERVSARFARKVADLYDRWWDQKPADHGVAAWVAERARRVAAEQQWPSPLAWDDASLDDPSAVPVWDAVVPAAEGGDVATRWLMGESVVLHAAARREVIAYLMEWSPRSPAEIAGQLEMTPEAVSRQWERIKARARVTGERVPARRLVLAGV